MRQIRQFRGSRAANRVSSKTMGLASIRVILLLVAMVTMSVVSAFTATSVSASHGGSEVCDPATGHCYEYVAGPVDWATAKAAAEAMTHNGVPGHLATMTSAAETLFVETYVADAVVHHGAFDGGAFIGAFQPAGSVEPAGGWQWVTGEAWSYTNWDGSEPNNSGGEHVAQFWGGTGAWNDVNETFLRGYLVEFDAPASTQTFDLDARLHGAVPPTHVSTNGYLDSGVDYRVEVLGNWAHWPPDTPLVDGAPDAVMFESPSVDYTGAQALSAANDAEYSYGDNQFRFPPLPALQGILFSLDGGSTFFNPVPVSTAYNPAHYYEYVVTGTGLPASFRTVGSSGDDHGVMQVTVTPDSDGDGVYDDVDEFPGDPSEWVDTDGDGVGDNADHYPNDPAQWLDPATVIYTVTQGSNTWNVTAVTTDPNETAVQYYQYGTPFPSSSNIGTETDRESQLFLYLDETTSPATVTLFITHDKPGSGGNPGTHYTDFTITGLPAGATVARSDDPTEFTISGSTATGDWRWLDCCTDGGALRLGSGDIDITISPDFYSGDPGHTLPGFVPAIDIWKLFVNDGDDPDDLSDDVWVYLDLTEDVQITRTSDVADADGDGYDSDDVVGGTDCDDANDQIHPGATEVLDGVDNDCDGEVDEGLSIDPIAPVLILGTPAGYPPVINGTASDDADREDANGNGVFDTGEDTSPADGLFDTDSGIVSVSLLPGYENLVHENDPYVSGAGEVTFTITLSNPAADGNGTLRVVDAFGNASDIPIVLVGNRPPVVEIDSEVTDNTVYYVDWLTASPAGGTATGEIVLPNGDIVGVEFTSIDIPTGDPAPYLGAQTAGGTNYWATSAPYISAEVPTGPPDSDLLQLSGGSSSTRYTVTFTEPIVGPIMPILSLGQPGIDVRYDFDSPFTIVSQGAGHFTPWWCNYCTLSEEPGNVLRGNEGHGTIVFDGKFSTFSWTVPTNEVWHGFTFAIRASESLAQDVEVDEGQTAVNTGTWGDLDGDTVTLALDADDDGQLTKNGDGTWSWSFDTTDGPEDSQTITITATDEHRLFDTASFELVVVNVAPSVESDTAVVEVDEGEIAAHTGTWGDPGDDVVDLEASEGTVTRNANGTWSWVADAAEPDGPTSYDVTITATDDEEATDSTTFTVDVLNVAPVADANVGGPYEVDEGSSLLLTGTGTDVAADELTFDWDLDGNGTYETSGSSATLDAALVDGPTTVYVEFRVSDDDEGVGFDTAVITVNNVAPTITELTGDNDLGSVTVSFIDAVPADTHTVSIDWGDGSDVEDVEFATSATTVDHLFPQFGTYTVVVTVADDDNGADSDTVDLIIGGGACECAESLGWWKQQYDPKKIAKGKTELTLAQIELLALMVGGQSAVFNGITLPGVQDVFDPPKAPKNGSGSGSGSKSGRNDSGSTASSGSSKSKKKKKGSKAGSDSNSDSSATDLSKFEEKALAQTLAAWLNFAKGAVDMDTVVDTNGKKAGGEMTFAELIAEVEGILSDPNATKADLKLAEKLAGKVNSLDKKNPDCETGTGSSSSGSRSGSGSGTGSN